jgi:nitrogen regulatory protein PII 2
MKEIMAVVRMDKMNATKRALKDRGYGSFTARKVLGRGKGNVDFRILRGAEQGFGEAVEQLGQGPKLIPKRMLTIVVPDDIVAGLVETIIEVNKTGKPGDGKIFILSVEDSIRVRTGERGDDALIED